MVESTNFVIVDCDIGSDDAWALLMLLRAERLKNVKVLAVTCVSGNTNLENVEKNANRFLNAAGRGDIPVYKGATGPLLPQNNKKDLFYFHGEDGFGDLEITDDKIEYVTNQSQTKHAVTAMYELVCQHPKQITFCLVGPLTNFALCLKMYADFSDKVKDVFIMGGNIRAVGNITRSAEFNFFFDPEAAHIVLEQAKCPITILPWEACLENECKISMDWRLKVLGTVSCPAVQLLNLVEKSQYTKQNFASWIPCDALVTAVFLFPEKLVAKESHWHATVELTGAYTRGQMVLDHLQKNRANVRVIEKIHEHVFKNIALCIAGHPDGNENEL